MKLNPYTIGLAAGALGLSLVAVYVWHRGVAGAAKDVGGAAVDAAGGVVTGVVDGVSGAVGLPSTDETTTDAAVARYVIDRAGYFEASKWAGAGALFKALMMPAGSGAPPAPGTPLAAFLATLPPPPVSQVDSETERLLNRYPAPAVYDLEPQSPTYAWGA
jgi:hypothetical protein